MKTEDKCPKHPTKFLFAMCDDLVCGECQDEDFTKFPPPPPPKRVVVPVWVKEKGKFDVTNTIPA